MDTKIPREEYNLTYVYDIFEGYLSDRHNGQEYLPLSPEQDIMMNDVYMLFKYEITLGDPFVLKIYTQKLVQFIIAELEGKLKDV